MISRKFIKSSFIYSVIGALPLASSILLLPFYTQFLSIDQYGQLALFIGFTLFIQVLIGMGMELTITNYYIDHKDDEKTFSKYVGTVLVSILVIGIGVALLGLLLGNMLFGFIFKNNPSSFLPYGFMCVITALCNTVFKLYNNLLISQQRPEKFLVSNLLNFILTIVISIAGLFLFPNTLIGPMWGRLLSGVGIFFFALFHFIRQYRIRFDFSIFKSILPFCLPLYALFLLSWSASYADRYIIQYYMPRSDVGIYDFALKCIMLIDFVIMGLNNAITPKIYNLFKTVNEHESTKEVNKYMHTYNAILLLMIAISLFVLPILVPIIVDKPDYYVALKYLPLLSLQYILKGFNAMVAYPLLYKKKTKGLPRMYFIISVVKIGAGFALIRVWGINGAIAAMLIATPIESIYYYYESRKNFSFKYNKWKMLGLPTIFTLIILAFQWTVPPSIWSSGSMMLCCLSLILFAFRKEVFDLYRANFAR